MRSRKRSIVPFRRLYHGGLRRNCGAIGRPFRGRDAGLRRVARREADARSIKRLLRFQGGIGYEDRLAHFRGRQAELVYSLP